MDDDGDVWELRRVRKPKGTHRPQSKNTPGAERDMLYSNDTGELQGPTESVPVYDWEFPRVEPDRPLNANGLTPGQQAAADLLAYALEQLIETAVIPLVKSVILKRRESKRLKATGRENRASVGVDERRPTGKSPSDAAVPPTGSVTMSSAEYRQQLYLTLAAEALVVQQKEWLAGAQVEDADLADDVKKAIDQALKVGVSSLNAEMSALIAEYLKDMEVVDGEAQPRLTFSEVATLHLTGGSRQNLTIPPPHPDVGRGSTLV